MKYQNSLTSLDSRRRGRAGALALLVVFAACGEYDLSNAPDEEDPVPPTSPATSTISAEPTEIKADGISTSIIRVHVRNPDGNPAREGGHFIALVTSLGTLSTVTDHNNGVYSAKLTSGTAPGTARVSGSVQGARITTGDPTVLFQP